MHELLHVVAQRCGRCWEGVKCLDRNDLGETRGERAPVAAVCFLGHAFLNGTSRRFAGKVTLGRCVT
jgi:hypothetical protein